MSSLREVTEGLQNPATVLVSLHAVNDLLLRSGGGEGGGGIRVGPLIPLLVNLLRAPAHEIVGSAGEVHLLSARAVNNVLDLEPRAALAMVDAGVLPALCLRLQSVSDMDVVEQCVKCLSLISNENPQAVLAAGGLKAATNYMDFYPPVLQRRTMELAVNLCMCNGSPVEAALILDCAKVLVDALNNRDSTVVGHATNCCGALVQFHTCRLPAVGDDVPPRLHWHLQALDHLASHGLVAAWCRLVAGTAEVDLTLAATRNAVRGLARLVATLPDLVPTMVDAQLLPALQRRLVGDSAVGGQATTAAGAGAGADAAPASDANDTHQHRTAESLEDSVMLIAATLPVVEEDTPKSIDAKAAEVDALCAALREGTWAPAAAEEAAEDSAADEPAPAEPEKDTPQPPAEEAAPPDKPDAAAPAAPPSEWACPACTYSNGPFVAACEICGSPNPSLPVLPSGGGGGGASAPAEATSWACPACTYNNPPIMQACEICGSPNPNPTAPTVEEPPPLASPSDFFDGHPVPSRTPLADVFASKPGLLVRLSTAVLPPLVSVAGTAASSRLRSMALQAVAAVVGHCPPWGLPPVPGMAALLSTMLATDGIPEVSAALRVACNLYNVAPKEWADAFVRGGVLRQAVRVAHRLPADGGGDDALAGIAARAQWLLNLHFASMGQAAPPLTDIDPSSAAFSSPAQVALAAVAADLAAATPLDAPPVAATVMAALGSALLDGGGVSPFELQASGVVPTLLAYLLVGDATSPNVTVARSARLATFLGAMRVTPVGAVPAPKLLSRGDTATSLAGDERDAGSAPALTALVRSLQVSLASLPLFGGEQAGGQPLHSILEAIFRPLHVELKVVPGDDLAGTIETAEAAGAVRRSTFPQATFVEPVATVSDLLKFLSMRAQEVAVRLARHRDRPSRTSSSSSPYDSVEVRHSTTAKGAKAKLSAMLGRRVSSDGPPPPPQWRVPKDSDRDRFKPRPAAAPSEDATTVCRFFESGRCARGDRCAYVHVRPVETGTRVKLPASDDEGVVVERCSWLGAAGLGVQVRWESGKTSTHRWGYQGKYDVVAAGAGAAAPKRVPAPAPSATLPPAPAPAPVARRRSLSFSSTPAPLAAEEDVALLLDTPLLEPSAAPPRASVSPLPLGTASPPPSAEEAGVTVPVEELTEGSKLDALDQVQRWCVATVTKRDGNRIHIHYDGWSDRWNEWLELDGDRVAPFRTHTTPDMPKVGVLSAAAAADDDATRASYSFTRSVYDTPASPRGMSYYHPPTSGGSWDMPYAPPDMDVPRYACPFCSPGACGGRRKRTSRRAARVVPPRAPSVVVKPDGSVARPASADALLAAFDNFMVDSGRAESPAASDTPALAHLTAVEAALEAAVEAAGAPPVVTTATTATTTTEAFVSPPPAAAAAPAAGGEEPPAAVSPPVPTSLVPDLGDLGWSCPNCTFLNAPTNTICEICAAPNPAAPAAPAAPTPGFTPDLLTSITFPSDDDDGDDDGEEPVLYTASEWAQHITEEHAGDSTPVVCQICAQRPGGDPTMTSSNIFGHIETRHGDLLGDGGEEFFGGHPGRSVAIGACGKPLMAGQRAFSAFMFRGSETWFGAVVTAVHPDGTVDLAYDDGDRCTKMAASEVVTSPPPGAKVRTGGAPTGPPPSDTTRTALRLLGRMANSTMSPAKLESVLSGLPPSMREALDSSGVPSDPAVLAGRLSAAKASTGGSLPTSPAALLAILSGSAPAKVPVTHTIRVSDPLAAFAVERAGDTLAGVLGGAAAGAGGVGPAPDAARGAVEVPGRRALAEPDMHLFRGGPLHTVHRGEASRYMGMGGGMDPHMLRAQLAAGRGGDIAAAVRELEAAHAQLRRQQSGSGDEDGRAPRPGTAVPLLRVASHELGDGGEEAVAAAPPVAARPGREAAPPLWISADGGVTRVTDGDAAGITPVLEWLGVPAEDLADTSGGPWQSLFTVTVGTGDGAVKACGDAPPAVSPPAPPTSAVLPPGAGPADKVAGVRRAVDACGDDEAAHTLLLLRLLRDAVAATSDGAHGSGTSALVPSREWVNPRVARLLQGQLRSPGAVLRPPAWCDAVVTACPTLLPIDLRLAFFNLTAFGPLRALHALSSTPRGGGDTRLAPAKRRVVVSRTHVLQSAMRLLEQKELVRSSAISVQFSHETGHGLGPTVEFYTLVCREAQRRSTNMWRDAGEEDADPEGFVLAPTGLFPAPVAGAAPAKLVQFFTFLGRFVGLALQDQRLLDLPLSAPFCKLIRGDAVSLADVKDVDPVVGSSLAWLEGVAAQAASPDLPAEERTTLAASVDDLCLQFTLPGHAGIELCGGGADKAVTLDNLPEYLTAVTRCMFVDGVGAAVDAFQSGFGDFADVGALKHFTATELAGLLSAASDDQERYWSPHTVARHVVCHHGYDVHSPQVQQLLGTVASLDPTDRRLFLRFITGSPRLPLGGFASLSPKLTIVKSVPPPGFAPDEMLPTCSTCQVYLKLPAYSSPEILRDKLLLAIREGQEHFALD